MNMRKLILSLAASFAVLGAVAISSTMQHAEAEATIPYSISVSQFSGEYPETSGGWNGWQRLSLTTPTISGWKCTSNGSILKIIGSGKYDEWLFSPSFNFRAGYEYEISFELKPYGSKNEAFAFAVNDGVTDVSNAKVFFTQEGTNSSRTTFTGQYQCDEDGVKNVALHVYTLNNQSVSGGVSFYAFNIVEKRSALYPAAVSDLTVTPADKGELKATIAFTAPSLDKLGNQLTSDLTVKIFKDEETTAAGTLQNVKPGSKQQWIDEDADNGETTYRVVAYDGDAEGDAAQATAWVGEDELKAVTDLTATMNADKTITVKWTKPSEGVHGYYVNADNISYAVTRFVGEEATMIAPTIKNDSFTDSYSVASGQAAVSYQIVPINGAGAGTAATSNVVNVGAAYELPFKESFVDANYENSGWFAETLLVNGTTRPVWTTSKEYYYEHYSEDGGSDVVATSQDVDNGLIWINTNYASIGTESRLVSPVISLKGKKNQMLRFYFWLDNNTTSYIYENARGDDRIALEISCNGGEFAPLNNIVLHRHSKTRGWQEVLVLLTDYAQYDNIRLGFHAISGGAGVMCLDNINVYEGPEYDAVIKDVTGKALVHALDKNIFDVTLTNRGAQPIVNPEFVLSGEGNTLTIKGEGQTVQPMETATIPCVGVYTKDQAGVEYKYDKISLSIASAEGTYTSEQDIELNVRVIGAMTPAVSDLSAQAADGKVTLTWGESDAIDHSALEVIDDFEDYDPFIISGVGSYTFVDLDKFATYYPRAAAKYDNAGAAMAYQVFNPGQVIDEDELSAWSANSGEQYLASFAPSSTDSGTANTANDWLISPSLSGQAQSISFYARHLFLTADDEFDTNDYEYPESFVVLYSDQDSTDPNDFLDQASSGTVTTQSDWTKYTYSLPTGTKRFAVRHITNDGYIMMLDDLTYYRQVPGEAECGFDHYEVYRDGVLIATTTERSYVDTTADAGQHEYYVISVYGAGQSGASNLVNLELSGVENVSADGQVAISVVNNKIIANGQGAVSVYNIAGQQVLTGDSSSVSAADLAAGVYIVRQGSSIAKVIIK